MTTPDTGVTSAEMLAVLPKVQRILREQAMTTPKPAPAPMTCRSDYYTDTGICQNPGHHDRTVRCHLEHGHDELVDGEPGIVTWPRRKEPKPAPTCGHTIASVFGNVPPLMCELPAGHYEHRQGGTRWTSTDPDALRAEVERLTAKLKRESSEVNRLCVAAANRERERDELSNWLEAARTELRKRAAEVEELHAEDDGDDEDEGAFYSFRFGSA